MNVCKKSKTRAWLQNWWRAILSCLIAVASLAGFLLVLLNPSCWFSLGGQCSGFDFYNAWEPYPGKGAGLQLFATGFLAAAAYFSWPALRDQIAHGNTGNIGAALLQLCLLIGYIGLLLGIFVDVNMDNPAIAKKLVSEPIEWGIIGLAISMSFLGLVFIFSAVWITIQVARLLFKKFFPSQYCALVSRCNSIRRLVRKKRP